MPPEGAIQKLITAVETDTKCADVAWDIGTENARAELAALREKAYRVDGSVCELIGPFVCALIGAIRKGVDAETAVFGLLKIMGKNAGDIPDDDLIALICENAVKAGEDEADAERWRRLRKRFFDKFVTPENEREFMPIDDSVLHRFLFSGWEDAEKWRAWELKRQTSTENSNKDNDDGK